ncbi:hypothetical protein F4703DRAFT_1852690 [Phycomyces blakesleeanus]
MYVYSNNNKIIYLFFVLFCFRFDLFLSLYLSLCFAPLESCHVVFIDIILVIHLAFSPDFHSHIYTYTPS